ncbi:MAG: GNAT family N-acetyltransferase [Acidimicrobiales bacterium]
MSDPRSPDPQVRPYASTDQPQVLALLADAMGRPNDDRFARLLDWKHRENAFGPSPAWVAEVDGEIAAYRAFLRWEFEGDDGVQPAVRAVDTATHPDHQRKGLFKALTKHGLDEVRRDGAAFVFNTPNESSRPGYLSMGWEVVGDLRPSARFRAPSSLVRAVRARVPASHWGLPSEVGASAGEAFADERATEELLASVHRSAGTMRTRRTPAYLRWRYDADLLGYRVLTLGHDLAEGAVCFRLRARGPAVEATIGDVLVPEGGARARRALIRSVLEQSRADYALVLGSSWRDGVLPVPGFGPTLVWRQLRGGSAPALGRWDLHLGDIELF